MEKNVISYNLKPLNKKAETIFYKIIDGVRKGTVKRINNSKSFMEVVIEIIYHHNIYGKVYSIGHYYTQMSDRMSDPEMTFLVNEADKRVYPISFEQHGCFARYEETAKFDEEGNLIGMYKKMNNEHKNFANKWLENIKHQQKL